MTPSNPRVVLGSDGVPKTRGRSCRSGQSLPGHLSGGLYRAVAPWQVPLLDLNKSPRDLKGLAKLILPRQRFGVPPKILADSRGTIWRLSALRTPSSRRPKSTF